jgi:polyisoprenoid-binding protein YceI
MEMLMKKLLLAAAMLAMTAPAFAAPKTYEIETPHTQIIFSVNHLGFSHSYGKFLEHDGTIVFDQENPENSNVDVTIQTASIEMNDKEWNDHMKNADFFDVEKFPTMRFKSTAIDVTGENTAKITGDLTIKDVTKPVVLNTTLNKVGKHPMSGQDGAGFSATTTIKRSEFNMGYGLPAVSDEVDIILEVESYTPAPAQAE